MPGTSSYTQPISKTMKHNVNIIVNDNKVASDKEKSLSPQNKNVALDLVTISDTSTEYDTKNSEAEGEELYEDIDKNQSTGLKITWRPWTAIYDIELYFHGTHRADQTEFTFEPHQISKIVIDEDFVANFADHISVVMTLTPNEMLLLLDNYRELKAHVYIRSMDPDTEYIDKEAPILDQDYMVILKDKEIRKRISKQSLMPNSALEKNDEHHNQQFTNVEIQLLTEKEYELKNKRFHFILTDATVKDAICYGVKQFNIQRISMPEPENTTKYVNLIIPPQQSFKAFIEFLQDRYGIYNEGCNFYYSDEIVFIYPTYKRTVTDCPETVHFYCTGDGSYAGMKYYHAKDQNNMYHVVINHTPVIKELIDSGAETYGNKILFENADYIIDKLSAIGEGSGGNAARQGMGAIDIAKVKTTTFSWDGEGENPLTDYGIINNPNIEEFVFTNNQMKYKSMLKSYRGSMCAFEWSTAEPYFIRPGYAVKWHIDGERDDYYNDQEDGVHHGEEEVRDTMEYKTYDGIAHAVIYTFMPAGTPTGSRYPFSCRANVVLDIDYLPAIKMKEASDTITNPYTEVSLQNNSAFSTGETFDATPTTISSAISAATSAIASTVKNAATTALNVATFGMYSKLTEKTPEAPITSAAITTTESTTKTTDTSTSSEVILKKHRKVTKGMKVMRELVWSDGSVTYIDPKEEIPMKKDTSQSKEITGIFDLS